MNGSQAPKGKGGSGDIPPAMGLPILFFGGLGFWWWQLGHTERMEWLSGIGRASGYGPVPKDMVEQIEWLVMHRMNDLYGLFLLFGLVAVAGVIEGNARRQSEALSGFGLWRYRWGRVLLLLWFALIVLTLGAPVVLPFGMVGSVLGLALFGAVYNMCRGFQRIH